MTARMLYVHALSPVHSGTGQSTDVIDLPVTREKVTGWPLLPGSSIKGVLRDACAPAGNGAAPRSPYALAFGPPTTNASDHAGELWFADAHLLCLPVRSYAGGFAWVSCPLALRRWRRDHLAHGIAEGGGGLPAVPTVPATSAEGDESILTTAKDTPLRQGQRVYLEDLDFKPVVNEAAGRYAATIAAAVFADPTDPTWEQAFVARFGLVADDVFTFLTQTATEITARVRLKETTKTVTKGGLWYEEAVPAESIFACPIVVAPRASGTADTLFGVIAPRLGDVHQIGGSASVGRGLVRLRLSATPAPSPANAGGER